MIGRNWTVLLLSIALGFALLIRLFPAFNHMASMQTVFAGAVMTYQNDVVQGNAGENSTGTCCDAMGVFSPVCDFMASQSAFVALYGGSEGVVNSEPIVRSIYVEAVIPPPKA